MEAVLKVYTVVTIRVMEVWPAAVSKSFEAVAACRADRRGRLHRDGPEDHDCAHEAHHAGCLPCRVRMMSSLLWVAFVIRRFGAALLVAHVAGRLALSAVVAAPTDRARCLSLSVTVSVGVARTQHLCMERGC